MPQRQQRPHARLDHIASSVSGTQNSTSVRGTWPCRGARVEDEPHEAREVRCHWRQHRAANATTTLRAIMSALAQRSSSAVATLREAGPPARSVYSMSEYPERKNPPDRETHEGLP